VPGMVCTLHSCSPLFTPAHPCSPLLTAGPEDVLLTALARRRLLELRPAAWLSCILVHSCLLSTSVNCPPLYTVPRRPKDVMLAALHAGGLLELRAAAWWVRPGLSTGGGISRWGRKGGGGEDAGRGGEGEGKEEEAGGGKRGSGDSDGEGEGKGEREGEDKGEKGDLEAFSAKDLSALRGSREGGMRRKCCTGVEGLMWGRRRGV